jgi:YcxB-like protein
VEIRYQCSQADYLESQLAHVKRTVGYYVLLVLGVLSVLIGSYVAYARDFFGGLILQIVGIFWLSFIPIRRMWLKRDFRKHPNFAAPQVVVLGEEGLRASCEIGEGTSKWAAYTKFRETPNLFMLYMGARLFRVIPKRAFSPPQLEEARALFCSKLPQK